MARTGLALAVDGGKGHERAAQDHEVRKGQREPLPVDAEHAGGWCAGVVTSFCVLRLRWVDGVISAVAATDGGLRVLGCRCRDELSRSWEEKKEWQRTELESGFAMRNM